MCGMNSLVLLKKSNNKRILDTMQVFVADRSLMPLLTIKSSERTDHIA